MNLVDSLRARWRRRRRPASRAHNQRALEKRPPPPATEARAQMIDCIMAPSSLGRFQSVAAPRRPDQTATKEKPAGRPRLSRLLLRRSPRQQCHSSFPSIIWLGARARARSAAPLVRSRGHDYVIASGRSAAANKSRRRRRRSVSSAEHNLSEPPFLRVGVARVDDLNIRAPRHCSPRDPREQPEAASKAASEAPQIWAGQSINQSSAVSRRCRTQIIQPAGRRCRKDGAKV